MSVLKVACLSLLPVILVSSADAQIRKLSGTTSIVDSSIIEDTRLGKITTPDEQLKIRLGIKRPLKFLDEQQLTGTWRGTRKESDYTLTFLPDGKVYHIVKSPEPRGATTFEGSWALWPNGPNMNHDGGVNVWFNDAQSSYVKGEPSNHASSLALHLSGQDQLKEYGGVVYQKQNKPENQKGDLFPNQPRVGMKCLIETKDSKRYEGTLVSTSDQWVSIRLSPDVIVQKPKPHFRIYWIPIANITSIIEFQWIEDGKAAK